MTSAWKAVFNSLQVGDLLIIPLDHIPNSLYSTVFAAVLGIENDGGVNLSVFSPDSEIPPMPYSLLNPFYWNDKVGALVGRNGRVPIWYSSSIYAKPGIARKVTEKYVAIPQSDKLRLRVSNLDMKNFTLDSRFKTLGYIVKNGDVIKISDQISLMLDVMGINVSHEQLVSICWIFELIFQHAVKNSDDLMAKLATLVVANEQESFLVSAPPFRQ